MAKKNRLKSVDEEKKLMSQLEVVRVSSQIIRNHTTMVSNGVSYTNGSHVGNCIQLLLLAFPTASTELIRHMVFHDYPEHVTGDIVGNAKVKYPKLKELVDLIEDDIDEEYKILEGYVMTPVEEKILKSVDRLELYLWCMDQYFLGCRNPRFMKMIKRLETAIYDFLTAGFELVDKENDSYHAACRLALINLEVIYYDTRKALKV